MMEMKYLINLVGLEDGETSGDVITKYGEFLGKWKFTENKKRESGLFEFFAQEQSEPLFSEGVGVVDSGMLTGLAMSRLCSSISDWHDEDDNV